MRTKIEEVLGYSGYMLSGSKSRYRENYPDNLVVFNANLFVDGTKVWFGDIDITKSKKQLVELSQYLDKEIIVLNEMDGRFENETNPKLENYVIRVTSDGDYTINEVLKKRYNI